MNTYIATFFFFLFSLIIPVFGQVDNSKEKPVEMVSETCLRIGTVYLDQEKREIYMYGKVNMLDGMIEVLACGNRGKLHESVFNMNVVPHDFQVALLLLGLKEENVIFDKVRNKVLTGDSLEILVSWMEGEQEVTIPAEHCLFNLKTQKKLDKRFWVFVGSAMVDGKFMADVEESLITTYHDPYSIIDNALDGADNDELYIPNSELLPPVNTSIKLTIKSLIN